MPLKGLYNEQIYDAIFDQAAFEALPRALTRAYGARSAVIGWHFHDGSMSMLSHSGYWSEQQVHDYAHTYADICPWTIAAIEDGRTNCAMNMDDLVDPAAFERSAFYNEFFRAAGDDTFRCIGVFAANKWGRGMVSVHRGKSQADFERETVELMDRGAVHIRRMLSLRGKFAAMERELMLKEAMLDAAGQPLMMANAEGRLLHANAAAEAMLARRDGISLREGVLRAVAADRSLALEEALQLASSRAGATASEIRVRRRRGAAMAVEVMPFRTPEGRRIALLICAGSEAQGIASAGVSGEGNEAGLTERERECLQWAARGKTAWETAKILDISESAVKKHLGAAADKLDALTRTQAVAAAVARGLIKG